MVSEQSKTQINAYLRIKPCMVIPQVIWETDININTTFFTKVNIIPYTHVPINLYNL